MSKVKLNLIAAACENMGIGVNGSLPWRLKKEMAYFTTMTTQVSDPTKVNAVIMGRRTWDCIPDKYRPLSNRVNIVLTHHVDALKEKSPYGFAGNSLRHTGSEHAVDDLCFVRTVTRRSDGELPIARRPQARAYGYYTVVVPRHFNRISIYCPAPVPEGVVVVPGLDAAVEYIESRPDIESSWVIGGSSIYEAAIYHPNCGKIYLTEIQKTYDCDTFFPNFDKQQFHLDDEEDIPGGRQLEGDISYYFRVYKKL